VTYFSVHVTYSQGVVKHWLVPIDTLVVSFAAVAGRVGKIRGVRFGAEVSKEQTQPLIAEGATLFYDSRFEAPQEVARG
jgi:hypothetical protein